MSGPNVLHPFTGKLAASHHAPAAAATPDNDLDAEDLGAYGWLRGVRERAIMLELRLKTGNIIALGYAWLERAEFDPTTGIKLTFTGQTITIQGRNLNQEPRPLVRLYDGLLRHRVPWIQEASRPTLLTAEPGAVVVERIDVG